MLPGFRFLFAATFLTMSVMVFGLGAAALLRTAHEQFASNPSWHAAPDANFAQPAEATRPVLAMLRFEPAAADQKPPADTAEARAAAIPAAAEQATTSAPAEPASSAEPAASVPPPAEIAALKAEPPADAKPDMPATESAAPSPAKATPADTPASGATTLTTPASGGEPRIATTSETAPETVPPPAKKAVPAATEADPAASAPASAPALPQADHAPAATKIATLDSPTLTLQAQPPAKSVSAPDRSAAKKRLRAQRAAHRRLMAARAARQARLAAQLASDPFAQSIAQPAPPRAR